MESKRGLVLLGFPVVAGIALVGALIVRRPEPPPAYRAAPKPAVERPTPRATSSSAVASQIAVRPSAPDVLASASEDARLRGTYQNFRTAVASGNAAMQKALERAIGEKRDAAMRLAQEDIARARTDRDREIARRTLDALRR